MKRKLIFPYSVLALLISCNNNTSSSIFSSTSDESIISSSSIDSSNSSSNSEENSYDYILEEDEIESFNTKKEVLNKLDFSKISIEGLDNVALDPFEYYFSYGEAIYYYPTSSLIENNIIFYSSNFYLRNSLLRNESCKEYLLKRISSTSFEIESIINNSNNIIPFNGAILSIPDTISKSYNIGEMITLEKGEIPLFKLGIYNDEGYRIAIRNANNLSYNVDGITLYDANTLSLVSKSPYYKNAILNVVFDEKSKSYKVDKFRLINKNCKVYNNINNGFALLANLNGENNENLGILNGIRFNMSDTVYFEDNGSLYNDSVTLKLGSNTYSYNNDAKYDVNVKISKSTSSSSSVWVNEVAIDQNGIIKDVGYHLDLPKNGYKLLLTGIDSSTSSERINIYANDFFKVGASVTLDNSSIIINYNISSYITNLYDIVNANFKEVYNNLVTYNYSYDYESLENIKEKLKQINNEIDEYIYNDDAFSKYYIYSLIGNLRQISNDIIASSNVSHAAMVRTIWYIIDFNSNDANIESITNHLTKIKNSGLNEIIISAMDDGKVYYSNSNIFEMDNNLKNKDYGEYGNDYLKAITSIAHNLGLKVFINFTPFTNGLEKAFSELNDNKALSINGKESVTTSQGNVEMLDPAADEVIEKIKLTINDFINCNPDIDGISLDYIRYGADSNNVNTLMGVTEDARIKFNSYLEKNSYSTCSTLDELRNKLKNNNSYLTLFNEFEQTLITDTVRNVKNICLNYKIPLTCAIADYYSLAKTWKCQDYVSWAKENIVDGLYLMDYYLDYYYVDYYYDDLYNYIKNDSESNSILVSAIDPSYARIYDGNYQRIINGALNYTNDIQGYGIFATHTQKVKKDGYDLISSANYEDVISPYEDVNTIIHKSIDHIINLCENIYLKYDNQTILQKESLLENLLNIQNYSSYTEMISYIEKMKTKTFAESYANDRINEELDYLISLIKLHININD